MKYSLITLLLISVATVIQAQTKTLNLDPDFEPKISITGTSSLHDWKVTGTVLEASQSLQMTSNDPSGIPEFTFKVPVAEMDGGRGSSMNNKINTAFNSAENPFVTYQQTTPAQVTKDSNNELSIKSSGNLSMAGVEKPIEVSLKGVVTGAHITFTGSKPLKMSDFGMTPPSAMFGQIKTHDDVVVHFEFRYLVHNEQ